MKPFFSVVVPCCDVEQYVRESLDSVVNQEFADWEILAVVETSKDGTEAVVREYAAKDVRIKMFVQPRSGSVSAPRNTALDHAQGEYVIFLDGDDTITDGSLQRLHDKIAARPGADLYPCAIQVRNEISGRDGEVRDNFPLNCNGELTGTEATLVAGCHHKHPCPMMQMTVCRRQFLNDSQLRCIVGLRRQDCEFSPRALYLAKCVVPLHEPFYIYRIRDNSITTSARGSGYFYGDWAIILRSLLAFHASVSKDPGFDRRVAVCWARQWFALLSYFWFDPTNIRKIPRARRLETLKALFSGGFDDFDALLSVATLPKRIMGILAKVFVLHPFLRGVAEFFFRLYFHIAEARHA